MIRCYRNGIMELWKTSKAVKRLSMKRKKTKRMTLKSPFISKVLKDLQKEFVFVPTDKASNNIAVVCKRFYVEQSMKELDIFLHSSSKKETDKTYVPVVKESLRSVWFTLLLCNRQEEL